MKNNQVVMNKKMQGITEGMENLNNHMGSIDERINELSGA